MKSLIYLLTDLNSLAFFFEKKSILYQIGQFIVRFFDTSEHNRRIGYYFVELGLFFVNFPSANHSLSLP